MPFSVGTWGWECEQGCCLGADERQQAQEELVQQGDGAGPRSARVALRGVRSGADPFRGPRADAFMLLTVTQRSPWSPLERAVSVASFAGRQAGLAAGGAVTGL